MIFIFFFFLGQCACNPPLIGTDCSINPELPPEVVASNEAVCDQRYTNCTLITVYGNNFVEGDVHCHFEAVDVSSS